jgi:hypothetical protein
VGLGLVALGLWPVLLPPFLDSDSPPFILLCILGNSIRLLLIDWPDICMSINGGDSEVVELALQLSGLAITVRGSPETAADFVRRSHPKAKIYLDSAGFEVLEFN